MQPLIKSNCTQCGIRSQSIFCRLSTADWSEIDQVSSCTYYPKGSIIFKEEQYPKGLYCIQSGKIKITQCGNDGKEQIVHLAKAGDAMGYRALLGEDRYSCSAQVLEDALVCFIPKDFFLQLTENNPKLTLQIVQLLSNELKEAESRITSTAQLPVINRVAEAILLLVKNYGFEQDQHTINIIVKRSELADLAGTSRETATRMLYELQTQKHIELIGKKIKVLNMNSLNRMSALTH